MLRFQVKNLLADPSIVIPVDAVYELSEMTVGGDHVRFLKPSQVTGELRNIGGGMIRFQGTVDMQVRMACSRCMKDTDFPLQAVVEQRYADEYEQVDEQETEDIEIFRNDLIDLEDLVRSAISMAIPMKVLCRKDCKGLCPVCGKDLNEGPCDCDREDTDPRWDALKRLMPDE